MSDDEIRDVRYALRLPGVESTVTRLAAICDEVLRLRGENAAMKAACDLAYHYLDRYGYRSHEDQIKSQDAVFAALRPFADFAGRL